MAFKQPTDVGIGIESRRPLLRSGDLSRKTNRRVLLTFFAIYDTYSSMFRSRFWEVVAALGQAGTCLLGRTEVEQRGNLLARDEVKVISETCSKCRWHAPLSRETRDNGQPSLRRHGALSNQLLSPFPPRRAEHHVCFIDALQSHTSGYHVPQLHCGMLR